MATVQHRSHAQDAPAQTHPIPGNPPMDVDPMLASVGNGNFNVGLKRKMDDPPADERGAPAPRLSMAQDGPQSANANNAMTNGPTQNPTAAMDPPHLQGPPHVPSLPLAPGPNPNHTQAQAPRTPVQRPGSAPGMQGLMSTPLSDGGRPLQIESSGRKVTIACENCRARKTRCDGGIPCARCVRSQTECLYDTERRRRGPHAGSRRTKTGPYSLEDFLESNVKRVAAETSASKANRQQRPYPEQAGDISFASAPGSFPPPSPTKSVKSAKGTSASENEAVSGTSKKVTFACQGCRQRKTRCDGCTPCASCARLKADCTYDTERKRRGPRVGYRRGGKAEAVAAAIVLTSQPNLLDPYASKSQGPGQEPVLWAQPEELRPLSPEPPPPTQFVPGPSLANLVDAHRTGQVPPPMPPVEQVNKPEGERENEDELQGESDYEGDESMDESGHVEGMLQDHGQPHMLGDDRPRRTVGSCAMCRVRKVKCDRVHPQCGSCAQHGQTCRYELPPKRRKRPLIEDPNPGAPPPIAPPGMQLAPGVPDQDIDKWVNNQDGLRTNGPPAPPGPPMPPPGMMPLPPPPGHPGVPAPAGPVGSPPAPVP